MPGLKHRKVDSYARFNSPARASLRQRLTGHPNTQHAPQLDPNPVCALTCAKRGRMRNMIDEAKLQRAAELLKLQTAKIRDLEAEIDRLNRVIEGSCDALKHLQSIYTDPRNPPSVT